MRKLTKGNNASRDKARAEDVKICDKCGEMIIGEFDHIQTRRGTKIYFHKGMKCIGRKKQNG